LPYINIGGANKGLADASNKNKRKGKEETPKLERKKKGSACELRKVFCSGKNPISSFFPDLVHDDRRQRGFIIENSLISFLPNLPRDKQDGSP
jgi:hypothetical protein